MSHHDKSQTSEIEKRMQKFSDLMPSIRVSINNVKRALVLIDGSVKSQTTILLSEELNRNFGAKIDLVCFYAKENVEDREINKQKYEGILNYAQEHLKSDDFVIKGEVVESVQGLIEIIQVILGSNEYDVIIVPTSFVGIREKLEVKDEDEEETQIRLMGDVFGYLLEKTETPVLLVESEKLNVEQLWKNVTVLIPNHNYLACAIDKALNCTQKNSVINVIINLNPQLFPDESHRTLEEAIKIEKTEMERFERANSGVFKELNRFIDYQLYAFNEIEQLRECLNSFGRDTGLMFIYLPSKHSSLYGLFVDILEEREIIAPLVILKKQKIMQEPKEEGKEHKEEGKEHKEEGKEPKEEGKEPKEEGKENEKESDLLAQENKDTEVMKEKGEEKVKLEEGFKDRIKNEVKREMFGEEREKEDEENQEKKKDNLDEEKQKTLESISITKESGEETRIKKNDIPLKEELETVNSTKETSEVDSVSEKTDEKMEELKEEIKTAIKAEIITEVKKEVKDEPKKELKKLVQKELGKKEMEELKEEILQEIVSDIKEEIKYELKKDMKEKKRELVEDIVKEIKEEEETLSKSDDREEEHKS